MSENHFIKVFIIYVESATLKRIIPILCALLLSIPVIYTQDTVGGVVNEYIQVDSVLPPDTVVINTSYALDSFERGDLVMLIQMKGAQPQSGTLDATGSVSSWSNNNTGNYEILSIDNVFPAQNRIVFTAEIMHNFTNGESMQLIKVEESEEDIIINSEVTAQPWDGETGGVAVLFSLQNIKLQADINVTGQGFRGADPDPSYPGGLNNSDTLYYDISKSDSAALKGEGYVSTQFAQADLRRGRGRWGNGGGGANGLYAGGGGGGHYGGGGQAGGQLDNDDPVNRRANGGTGIDISGSYNSRDGDYILMGGGGGTSTQNPPTRVATSGGNGGGMVILIADSVIGNGFSILARGESVTSLATAGGGGGGAGGAVFLDVNGFATTLDINAQGGVGGNTDGDCTGAGGGGGGGVIAFSASSTPPGINTDVSEPAGGSATGCSNLYYSGNFGDDGGVVHEIQVPLNGYYFNAVEGSDTLCEEQTPEPLTGSIPKGGTGDFEYTWQVSSDNVNWSDAPDQTEADSLAYQPPVVTSTVYYRRIVEPDPANGGADTSKILELFVFPKIEDNTITSNDTICYGATATPISGNTITAGGDGDYHYQWEWNNDLTEAWNNGPSGNTNNNFELGTLVDTTYIRRVITSAGVCSDVSDTLTIIVLPEIENNLLLENTQTICENNEADTIRLTAPAGGEPAYYEYEWLRRDNASGYTSIPSSNIADYPPGVLTDSMHYKRIVKSGIEQACKDTSEEHSIFVLPAIANNMITDLSTICAGEQPESIPGSLPQGGNSEYTYKWLQNVSATGYSEAPEGGVRTYMTQDIFEDTTYFKRVVMSGLNDACIDTSNEIRVEVIPYITNPVQSFADSLCAGESPEIFSGQAASGGDGSFTYQWEWKNVVEDNAYSAISGANNISYQSPALMDSTHFRRAVVSNICTTYSDTFRITVFPAIQNNTYNNGLIDSTCYNESIEIDGTAPKGGLITDRRFIWQESMDMMSWQPATDAIDDSSYQTPALTDSIFYRRIVQSGLSNECIDTAPPILIRINPLPWGDIQTAYDSICEGEAVEIQWQFFGNAPWNVTVSDGINTYSSTDVMNDDVLSIVPQDDQDYTLQTLTDGYGCAANDTNYTNEHITKVSLMPVANAGEDTSEFCGLDYELNARLDLPEPAYGYWTTSFTDLSDEQMGQENLVLEAEEYGEGTFIWSEINGVCSDRDTTVVMLYEQPGQPDAGEDQELDFTFNTTLEAAEPNAGHGHWTVITGPGELEDPFNQITRVTDLQKEENIFEWTVENGVCQVVSDEVIVVVHDLQVPKGFSPNGDGHNDRLIIEPNDGGTLKVIIFNRFGNLVYETENYGVDNNYWDGTNLNGDPVPAGTYFYIIRIKETGEEIYDFVVLKR